MAGIGIIFFIVLSGWLAARKNRSVLFWGMLGCIPILAFLVLAFMPYLCPKCKKSITNTEWKNRTCPQCGDVSKEAMEKFLSNSPRRVEKLILVGFGWTLIGWLAFAMLSGMLVGAGVIADAAASNAVLPLLVISGFISALLTKLGKLPGTKVKQIQQNAY